jgi:hypothetical protein
MDTTIRNLDGRAYRALRARAALEGKTVGAAVNEAIRAYLERAVLGPRHGSLRDLVPRPLPEGTEHLSEAIDAVVYGA